MPWDCGPESISALANVGTVLITGIAGWIGIATFRHQRTTSDIQMALGIFSSINSYWDRAVSGEEKEYNYNMGQILAHFEMAALLFNERAISSRALPILKDHIIEVFSSLMASDAGRSIIELCKSSETTFEHLRTFLRKYRPQLAESMDCN